jgi:anti-anti-sigma regulatory factor
VRATLLDMAITPTLTGTSVRSVRVANEPRAVNIVVTGPLVLESTSLLRAVLVSALDGGAIEVRLDLGAVSDIDTAGLATLVMAARRLRGSGVLRFCAMSRICVDTMDQLHLFTAERQDAQSHDRSPEVVGKSKF